MINKHIAEIQCKLTKNSWAIHNPSSTKEVISTINQAYAEYSASPGFVSVLKTISRDLNDNNSIRWLNYFSQIRCAYFLQKNGIKVTAFEKKNGEKRVDLELNNRTLCEIKSFEAIIGRTDDAVQTEEYVFDNFLKKKLIPAFDDQGAGLVMIDDIFSDTSKNFHFLNYFLSFIDDPESDRYQIIKIMLGKYLPNIMVVSFTQSMVEKPVLRFVGENWKNYLDEILSKIKS